MGLYTYFHATINRVYIEDISSCLSSITRQFIMAAKVSDLHPEDNSLLKKSTNDNNQWIKYHLLWDGIKEDYFCEISVRKEHNHHDGHTNGYEIGILTSEKRSYKDGMFSHYVQLCKKLGGCSYEIYSEYDENLRIKETFEKYGTTNLEKDTFSRYYCGTCGQSFFGCRTGNGFRKISMASLENGRRIPTKSIKEINNSIDKWVEERKEKYAKKYSSKWKPSIYRDFSGVREDDYFGVKTNVFFFVMYILNKYGFETLEDLKTNLKSEHIKEYTKFITSIYGETKDRTFYTFGVMPFIETIMAKEELEKLNK